MSQTARKWFVRRAKAYGLDTSTGVFGEWSDKETRKCWYFWIMSWQLRARDINKRSKRASVDKLLMTADRIAELESELSEQAKLNGAGSER